MSEFELPQDPKTSWKDAGGWISGYKDPSYLVYYEAFPEGEESAWQFPGNEMLYAGLIINGVLTVLHIGPIAEGIKKLQVLRLKKRQKKQLNWLQNLLLLLY